GAPSGGDDAAAAAPQGVERPVAPDALDALLRVLSNPTVADKTFLITIADRTVTGRVHRDQMCGPWQLPVADNAVVTLGYHGLEGSAMACGERSPVAVADAPASGRLAVAEAVLNLASAGVPELGQVKLSANWMAACGQPGQDAALFDTVKAVAEDFCPAAGLSIPVGKDSCSMSTVWDGRTQLSPVSLVVSAFGPVPDVSVGVTPDLKRRGGTSLALVDFSGGLRRLGGSVLAQCWGMLGGDVPDFADPKALVAFWPVFQRLLKEGRILAAHDVSDGGLAVAVAEMAMAGGCGVRLKFAQSGTQQETLAALFAEEPGMVLQVADVDLSAVESAFFGAGLSFVRLGSVTPDSRFLSAKFGETVKLDVSIARLRSAWSETSACMRELRDNPESAAAERQAAADERDPGLSFEMTYDPASLPVIANASARPRVAIFREEGVNGHVEMAAAFDAAGFEAVDVHVTDLVEGRESLARFAGLAACGGFSYGDVLGAGSGWAGTILHNAKLRDAFAAFFARPETFTLGVCNGCQMVSQLRSIIPGAEDWPRFIHNRSTRFEARYATVEVMRSPSVLLRGMEGSRIPIAVAHGEGFARFETEDARMRLLMDECAALRYVDNSGAPTERYPFNPNGSAGGLTGFTTRDGRATIMMPHPERGFRSVQLSYRPDGFCDGEAGPWLRMFRNARAFVG
ncbi:MAG: phosphoribosylformylglycinamidine synthase, partial [Kiritimatiellae bacterium]|nr:phosphoribosylformylglycinamidine synthase [Kiritimatiellia bacterium]